MAFLINPIHPVVWRDPHSLQIGIDTPLAVLTNVNRFEQRAIGALTRGVSRGGLEVIARECGLGHHAVNNFLALIKVALEGDGRSPLTTVRVALDGNGPTSNHIRVFLQAGGFPVETHFPAGTSAAKSECSETSPFCAVIVSHFITEPSRHSHWLRRDIPHLPVVFSDQSITIGPFVEPGIGPCLHCTDKHKTDDDPSWPAIASQLVGRTCASETPYASWLCALLVTRSVWDRVNTPDHSLTSASLQIHLHSGRITRHPCTPHPECGCRSLEEIVSSRAA